jgi:TRAP-type mannitol/chloroaromatic compound transport system permease small subunit|tara:strand:+ start:767 stop:1267 length:501 start_codon:yes stop_codon:yes gene_type:complete
VRRFITAIDAVNQGLGQGIAWLTAFMVALTLIVVVIRYAFDAGAIALQESVTYLHALVIMLGIPHTLKVDAHVRVDILYSRLRPAHRAAANLAGHTLFLAPVAVLVLYTSLPYVVDSWRVLEGSPEVGGIPAVFLLKTLIPVMAVLLLAQGIADSIRLTLGLVQRD